STGCAARSAYRPARFSQRPIRPPGCADRPQRTACCGTFGGNAMTCLLTLQGCHRAVAMVAILAVLTILAGCNRGDAKPVEAAIKTPPLDPLEITATPTMLERIRIGEPSRAQIGASFTVSARVEVDETRVTRVGSPVMGRIIDLAVREGQE